MRRMLPAVVMVTWATAAQAGIVHDFSDIRFWAGSGTNQAALVLDFGTVAPQGSPPAVAWGYRWDGTASLADMVFGLAGTITGSGAPAAVAGSDPRLGVDATYDDVMQSYYVNAFTYDQVGLPAGWSQEVLSLLPDYEHDIGIAQYEAPSAAGSWPSGGVLNLSALGIADTPLASGGWYGYVTAEYVYTFDNDGQIVSADYPSQYVFSQPTAAVPEPSSVVLLAWGGVAAALVAAGRRRDRLGSFREPNVRE